MRQRYADRAAAGADLGSGLAGHAWTDPVVLALPRGGVPVAAGVADALAAPLDVVVARKIGAPTQPELAVGAVTSDGAVFFDDSTLRALHLRRDDVHDQIDAERSEARRRLSTYRSLAPQPCSGRDVIIVDDGLATGLTALAAVHATRAAEPASVTVAVPVGASPAVHRLATAADAVYCPQQPAVFRAVGQWYRDFTQVTDDEVRAILTDRARRPATGHQDPLP